MFDTVESSSSSLDRGVMNWTSLLSRQTRQTSADRIQTQQTIDQKPLLSTGGAGMLTNKQPDVNTDEAMFENAAVDSSSTTIDRGVINLSSLLRRQTRQTSADRIQTQTTVDQKPVMPSSASAASGRLPTRASVVQNSTAYRQQIIIMDDHTTTPTLNNTISNVDNTTSRYFFSSDLNTYFTFFTISWNTLLKNFLPYRFIVAMFSTIIVLSFKSSLPHAIPLRY